MISFVIPAYNEELFLGRTLGALNDAAQSVGQPFEVLVVDDSSTDHTAAVARECGARVVRKVYAVAELSGDEQLWRTSPA